MFNEIPQTLGVSAKRVTDSQKKLLMERFQANAYLTKEEIHQLASSLNMRERTVKNWFNNMRRVKQKEGKLISESYSVLCFPHEILY